MKTSKEFFQTIFQHYAFHKWIHIKIGDKVQHVGGDQYATEIETRIKNKESYFSPMLYGTAQHQPLNGYAALWVEFENFDETKAKVMDAFPLQPSIVVKNATRRVVFWVFRKPEPLTNGEHFESALIRVASVLGGVVCKIAADAAKAMLPVPNKGGWEIIELNHSQYQLSDFDSIGRVITDAITGEVIEPQPVEPQVEAVKIVPLPPTPTKTPYKGKRKDNKRLALEGYIKDFELLRQTQPGGSCALGKMFKSQPRYDFIRDMKLTKGQKIVLSQLIWRAGDKGKYFGGQIRLAMECGLSHRHARRLLQELAALGSIRITSQGWHEKDVIEVIFQPEHMLNKVYDAYLDFIKGSLQEGDRQRGGRTARDELADHVSGTKVPVGKTWSGYSEERGAKVTKDDLTKTPEMSPDNERTKQPEMSPHVRGQNMEKCPPSSKTLKGTPCPPKEDICKIAKVNEVTEINGEVAKMANAKCPPLTIKKPTTAKNYCNGNAESETESERQDMSEGEADSQDKLPRCFSQFNTCKTKTECAMAAECESAVDGCFGQGYSADAHCCVTCEIGMQCKMATEARGNADKC
jgi:hypothetical protein